MSITACSLVFLFFALFPLFWLFKVAVTPTNLLYSEGIRMWPSETTWANFAQVMTDTDFPQFFINSAIVSGATALISTLIAAAAGYSFSRFQYRGKAIIIVLMLITQMFPLVMLIAPIFRILTPLGLTDSLLGLVVVYTAFNVPFATFLMQSFFDGIPKDLEEAAMIDGNTRFGALVKIIFPAHPAGYCSHTWLCVHRGVE